MVSLHKIMPQLKKAISALQTKPDLWGGDGNRKLNVEVLEEIAANHLFDKLHDSLGITERAGLSIWSYFQDLGAPRLYQFVVELHKAFPSLANESAEYVSCVNYYRSLNRLPKVDVPTEKRPVMKCPD